jgi:hypothetical protein
MQKKANEPLPFLIGIVLFPGQRRPRYRQQQLTHPESTIFLVGRCTTSDLPCHPIVIAFVIVTI